MGSPEEDSQMQTLSDIYNVLSKDAKQIVADLEGGVVMWREAAAGALASSGFLAIMALTYLHENIGNPFDFLGSGGFTLFIGLVVGMAVVMAGVAAIGLWRYFKLRRKYAGLFAKAHKLV